MKCYKMVKPNISRSYFGLRPLTGQNATRGISPGCKGPLIGSQSWSWFCRDSIWSRYLGRLTLNCTFNEDTCIRNTISFHYADHVSQIKLQLPVEIGWAVDSDGTESISALTSSRSQSLSLLSDDTISIVSIATVTKDYLFIRDTLFKNTMKPPADN